MTATTTTTQTPIIKESVNLQIITSFDDSETIHDYLTCKIKITPYARETLKKVCLAEKVNYVYASDERKNPIENKRYFERSRYQVKRFLYSDLQGMFRDILFDTELIDTGEIIIYFPSSNRFEEFMRNTRYNLKRAIELILNYINLNVTFKVE